MIRVRGWPLLAVLPTLAGASCEATEVGAPAPAFELTARDGSTHSLGSLTEGKVLRLDFGSVFCWPCREVLAGLVEARRTYAGRGLRVAAVNVDGPRSVSAVNSVCSGLGVTCPVLLDAYGVEAIPCLALVDSAGTVRAVHLGRAPDLAAAVGLKDLLANGEGLP